MFTVEKFEEVPRYEALFGFTFIPVSTRLVHVLDNETGKTCGAFTLDGHEAVTSLDLQADSEEKRNQIVAAYNMWCLRPEHALIEEIPDNLEVSGKILMYERLLVGSFFMRAIIDKKLNPDCVWDKVNNMLEWVRRRTDFYTAPGSTRFHDNVPNGLLNHTLKVVKEIRDLQNVDKFKNIRLDQAVLVALVHDWCKIGLYESFIRNVKNDATGEWEKREEYRWRQEGSPFPFGHGETSMYLVGRFISLTMEEAAAIRWHMGAWHASQDQRNDLNNANERFPLVLMLQFADSLATTRY